LNTQILKKEIKRKIFFKKNHKKWSVLFQMFSPQSFSGFVLGRFYLIHPKAVRVSLDGGIFE
jgi:hypothetical protein